jgi:hypothetical protein
LLARPYVSITSQSVRLAYAGSNGGIEARQPQRHKRMVTNSAIAARNRPLASLSPPERRRLAKVVLRAAGGFPNERMPLTRLCSKSPCLPAHGWGYSHASPLCWSSELLTFVVKPKMPVFTLQRPTPESAFAGHALPIFTCVGDQSLRFPHSLRYPLKTQGKSSRLQFYLAGYPPEPPNHNFKERVGLGCHPTAES